MKVLKQEEYLCLKEKGFDLKKCSFDYSLISVKCEDLSLYKKAFRVKIRALLKTNDIKGLRTYVNAFYTLAQFARYLYGFHSCADSVASWQETLAYELQQTFVVNSSDFYKQGTWLKYKDTKSYRQLFTEKYNALNLYEKVDEKLCIQDEKPFLNEKDKAHFTKGYL